MSKQWSSAGFSHRPSTPPLLPPPISIPHTPQGDKIRRIVKNRKDKDVGKAGQMVATEVFFNNGVLKRSGLASDHG